LYSYDFSPATPANLTRPRFYRSAVLGDNVVVDPQDGGVYLSGLPSLPAFAKNMASPEAPMPGSATVRLVERAGNIREFANSGLRKDEAAWEGVFVDDGMFYGGISTGGMVRGKFVGAGLVEKGVVVCDGHPMRGRTKAVKKEEVVKDEESAKDEL